MFKTLYSRLALALLVILGLTGVMLAQLIGHSSAMYQQEVAQKLNRQLAQYIASEFELLRNGQVDGEELDQLFHQLMIINPSIELYLLDREGRILDYYAPDRKIKRDRIDLAPVEEFLEGEMQLPFTGDDPRAQDGSKVFSAAEISNDRGLQGYLYVILRGEDHANLAEMVRQSYVLDNSMLALILALAASLLGGLIVFAMLTRRLRKLAGTISDYASNRDERASIRFPARTGAQDEIDMLGSQFNSMADRIDAQLTQLREMDSQRREMVANVSHDLRTPLTTMRGYLETLLIKDEQLDADEKRQYLETALKYTERLSKLIEELFELARLESCEAVVYSEPFSISELVQDVTQSFGLRAEQQSIHLVCDLKPNTPLIHGDIAMMQRVLENLLENALRHTPAGGAVQVSVDEDHGRVRVRVSDSGQGIPEQELPRIFDRFYQLDATRGQHGNAGLGLSVVKRILELHGSVINVNSRRDEGTTFSFLLSPLPQA